MITCRTFRIQISDILLFKKLQDDLMYQGKTVLYSNFNFSSDYVNWYFIVAEKYEGVLISP
jgi:hypothetical protein